MDIREIIYLLEADDNIPLIYRIDESSGAKWISFDEAYNGEIVEFIRHVNKKLAYKFKERNSL